MISASAERGYAIYDYLIDNGFDGELKKNKYINQQVVYIKRLNLKMNYKLTCKISINIILYMVKSFKPYDPIYSR